MKKLIILFAAIFAMLAASAETPYSVLESKADGFYSRKEWPSASAMLDLMLDRKPNVISTYAKSIVASAQMHDTTAMITMTARALDAQIPVDSLFCDVRRLSFELGETNGYEDYLLLVGDNLSWLKRPVQSYLLDYYVFRRNGKLMVEYARIMLEGLPEDSHFMNILAQGYLIEGYTAKAVDVWERSVVRNPDDLEALIYLGNYYYDLWKKDKFAETGAKAFSFLNRAYKLKPTPRLEKMLERIRTSQV